MIMSPPNCTVKMSPLDEKRGDLHHEREMHSVRSWHVNLSEFAGIESLLLPCQALLTKWNESRRQGNERTS